MSVDYYTRLERGRAEHPSDQVLHALARALRLDDEDLRHLHELARPPILRTVEPVTTVPLGLAHIVDSWHGPVTVADRSGLVIAANSLAQALSPAHTPGANGYRSLFLDPAMKALYANHWQRVATDVVAALHAALGSAPRDPRLKALVGELSVSSDPFRELWAHYDVGPRSGAGTTHMHHPIIGPIRLDFQKLGVTDHPDLGVVLFWAQPGTADEDALLRLAMHEGASRVDTDDFIDGEGA
jgi:transcriptional regulator with XRE-family HTH domain